jgi:predicted nucleic acid-binding protein
MSGTTLAIVDAGPLYAVTDTADADHRRSLAVLQRADLRLVMPALVVTEVTYMVGRRLGPAAEATFLRGLKDFDIEAPTPDDWLRMADLVEQYANFPLGGTDASVVALAERLGTDVVITLDYRHFGAIRPRHCAAFRLLPA